MGRDDLPVSPTKMKEKIVDRAHRQRLKELGPAGSTLHQGQLEFRWPKLLQSRWPANS